MERLCPGGMDLGTAFSTCSKPKMKCRIETQTCYKYVICSEVGKKGNWPIVTDQMMSAKSPPSTDCRQEHIWNAIVCCEYTCMFN